MKIKIKESDFEPIRYIDVIDVDYSIGDIVKITDYGSRAAEQNRTCDKVQFPLTNSMPLNIDNDIVHSTYHKCNEIYSGMEWKIIDIGYHNSHTLLFRLRNRGKDDLIFIYDCHDKTHDLKRVRKAKKDVVEHTIIVKHNF